ncbi:hypothetical protein GS464_29590 [Rhodococcus hoagii]|nr:hypothetical protein [Prescottella equi]MBM4644784.1 hypothetical protein [Prescottella equi]MBM4646571.1 hypothetical protein [Prescottella equi]
MASNTTRKRTSKQSKTLQQAKDRFQESWDYAKANWHDKWDRDTKLYDNERVDAQYKGVTDTFVPMVFSTVETMVAALNNASLRFDYKTADPMRQASTAPLNALVDEWWDDDQWDLALEEGTRDMLITGMAAFMLSWEINQPHLDHFSMRDAIVDPTIKNPRDLQQPGAYAGRRYLVRKGTLEQYKVVDTDEESPTYGELIKRYKLPKDTGEQPEDDDDKSSKERTQASTLLKAEDKQDEVVEIWDIDRVVTMLNRQHIIEDVENPYKTRHRTMLKNQYVAALGEGATPEDIAQAEQRAEDEATGLVPFFFFRNYRKTSLFYARSEVDAIAKPQENLNDLTNMETDYIIRQLAPQKELDPQYADFIDLIDNEPDTVYPFVPGSLVDRQVPVLPPNSFNNRMNIKNEMRETTAVDQLAKGIANVKQTTATEVDAQMSQTSQRIESKARIMEKDGLYWMAHIVFRMFQLYVDKPLIVEVKGADADELRTTIDMPDGTELQLPKGAVVLDPKDYQGTWRPKVTLEIDAATRKVEEQQANTAAYQIVIQDPTNNLAEAKKILYPKMFDLTKEEIERITTPDPAQMMGMGVPGAEGDPMAQGGAPMPLDPAMAGEMPPEPLPGGEVLPAPEGAEGEVDTEAVMSSLTPEELSQLNEILASGGGAQL